MSGTPSFEIERLGPAERPSPVTVPSDEVFVDDSTRLFLDPHLESVRRDLAAGREPPGFEVAGPRARIFFDPETTRAAIATCGGLSPGLNDVIRALVLALWHRYGLREIFGVGHGYQGLRRRHPEWRPLEPETVRHIHEQGGTLLGTSRGTPPTAEIVDSLQAKGIDLFFPIGGDGTMRGALEISREAARRGLPLAVVALPKTIDNDIPFVRRSFGFETAVMRASDAVRSAHLEAQSVHRGIGLVKLMGRHSGYVAASAALATGHANFCLVPEVEWSLEGAGGLLSLLEERLAERSHALIVVAEGAGQYYFKDTGERDPSGNRKLGDVGLYLKHRLVEHFKARGAPVRLKYIDPSYLVRSAPANPSDSLHCARLAQNAVHAAMAGRTAMLLGYWHGRLTHVPLAALAGRTRAINPRGELWWNVLESTGQPVRIGDPALIDPARLA